MECAAWISKYCYLNFPNTFPLAAKWSCAAGYKSFCRFCVFQTSFCVVCRHLWLRWPSEKTLKGLCWMKGRTPAGSMNPLSHPAAPPLSWSPLRLFAQAVAVKTAHSVWMFFSQARAAGYMFAFPPLSKATFTSGPEEKGSTVYESMQAIADSATLKLSARLVCAGRRVVLALFYIYFFLWGPLTFPINHDVFQRSEYLWEAIKNEWLIFTSLSIHTRSCSALWRSPVLFIQRHQRNELESCISLSLPSESL